MRDEEYPALFRSADRASNKNQSTYLSLIRAEYALLLLAAVFSMNFLSGATFYSIYSFIFLLSICTLLTRALLKPEQDWYKCRALAESVKTLSWRYMLRAEPFNSPGNPQIDKNELRNHLKQLLDSNHTIAERISPDSAADDQITQEMERVRSMSLALRKQHYIDFRVQNQRSWYAKKASQNSASAKRWVAIGVVSYAIAAMLALARIQFPSATMLPIEPIIVFASSVIGWMQIKKFNELSAAYTVTAHEIGLIRPTIENARTEQQLSEAVNDAELAFSREHTMWIARQTS